MPGASATDDIERRILTVFDGLTRKQKQLARCMLDNQVQLAFSSAEELGRHAGVDAATVVRFSQLLGYQGYADLRDSVRSAVPEFLTAVEKVSRTLAEPASAGDLTARVFSQDLRNIEDTARMNAPQALTNAVGLLERANRVAVLGLGVSHAVAVAMAHQLSVVGVVSQPVPGELVAAGGTVTGLSSDDVLVAFNLWRYLEDTRSLFQSAKEGGAKTLLITDSRLAPLASDADAVLLVAAEAPELSHSIAALVTLSNVLVTGVALADPERTLASLQNLDRFYASVGVVSE